jgi:predicted membrane protein
MLRSRRVGHVCVRPLTSSLGGLRTALDTSSLLWGLLFGSIGLGFFVYGRRQKKVVPLVCGLALIIFPYFVSNTILLVTLGIVLIAIPYFVRM